MVDKEVTSITVDELEIEVCAPIIIIAQNATPTFGPKSDTKI